MKATAVTTANYTHRIAIRQHALTADEPAERGGADLGPTPQELLAASLASCMAITMQMYARRKGWELGKIEVVCEYEQAERGAPTHFELRLRLPAGLEPQQVERLSAIAARCPVHRALEGEVTFSQRVQSADA